MLGYCVEEASGVWQAFLNFDVAGVAAMTMRRFRLVMSGNYLQPPEDLITRTLSIL